MKHHVLALACLLVPLLFKLTDLRSQTLPVFNDRTTFQEYKRQMNDYYRLVGRDKDGYKQWKRLEWYFSTRMAPDGRLANVQQLKQDAISATYKRKALGDSVQQHAVSGAWSQVGPMNINNANRGIGRVNRIAFHPTNENTLYAATPGGGLWKTVNGGSSWQALTDGLPNLNLSDVKVDPSNPNIIYILTGDADGGGGSTGNSLGKNSTGVLRSVDGGITWNYTGLKWAETDGIIGYKLVIHPSDFDILMVASNKGIFYSDNSGNTWTQKLKDTIIYDIEFMPNNGQVVYAGAYPGLFLKSVNGGISWRTRYANPNPMAGRVSIAVTPAASSEVFMMIGNRYNKNFEDSSYTFSGIYHSASMGDSGTWKRRISAQPNIFNGSGVGLIGRQQAYDHALAVNPYDSKKLATGGVSLWISTDGGVSLLPVSATNETVHVDIHDIAYPPSTAIIYAATDGGIYRSLNDGTTWTSLNNSFPISQYYRISVSQSSLLPIIGGAQDNGSHLRTTLTSTFDVATGGDGMDNAISRSNPNYMFTSKQNGTFWRSTNNFGNVTEICSEPLLADQNIEVKGPWVTNIEVSPTNPNLVYFGYSSVIKATFNGIGWFYSNIGANNSERVSGVTLLKLAPSNLNVIYAGDNDYDNEGARRLWRTTDGGLTWSLLNVPSTVQPFSNLCINPNDENEIWLSYGGFSDNVKIYHSQNGGQRWTNISGSLPNIPVNCILFGANSPASNDALYIGTDIGVFYRDNSLGDWVPFSTGLPMAEVTDLELNESSGIIRAGTYGRGMWQTATYSNTCPTNETFTTNSHPPSEPAFVSVTNTIASTAIIKGVGATIQYKAGVGVTLSPGFRIDGGSGARFVAYTGPCPGGGVPSSVAAPTVNGLPGYLLENN